MMAGKKATIKVKQKKVDGSGIEEIDKVVENDVGQLFKEREDLIKGNADLQIKGTQVIEKEINQKKQYAEEAVRATMAYDELKERVSYYKQGTNLTDLTNA